MSEETEKKIPLVPEVLDSIDEAEAKSKAFKRIRAIADAEANPTAKRYIDWDEFKNAAERFMKLKDIALLLGVSRETLNNRCKKSFNKTSKEVWEIFSSTGKRVLSSRMYDSAINGNTSMQIWLSKTCMGYQEPEKKIIDPNAENKDSIKKIVWAPSIKGFEDCTPEKLQDFMVEFLDLPAGHKLKGETTGKNAMNTPGGEDDNKTD